MCVNLSILAKFTQTRSRQIYLNKLDLNRAFLLEILEENVVGKSCMKILWENIAGNSCGKILLEILARKSRGNFLPEILQENLTGNSCGKILWKNFVGNAAGNSAGNLVRNSCRKFLQYPQTNFEANFENMQVI